MADKIEYSKNKSLLELDIIPGQIVAFDNNDYEWPHPFLLAIPEKLVKGFEETPKGIKLIYWHGCDSADREEWTLHTQGKMIGLWSPNVEYREDYKSKSRTKSPNIKIMKNGKEYFGNNSYVIEKAFSGKDAVLRGLQNAGFDLRFYADCMEKGKLVMERGRFGGAIKKAGLESLLPDQLRFTLF